MMENQGAMSALLGSHAGVVSQPGPELVYLEKIADANSSVNLDRKMLALGKALDEAFHNKSDVTAIKELVKQGAPVNYRLDYGLEISLESHFVYQFFLLLEGDKGLDKLRDNIAVVFKDNPNPYYNYISTAADVYHALHACEANIQAIAVNPNYISALKNYVSNGRANPYHRNGTLIIAAGLRDPALVQDIINQAQSVKCDPLKNGGLVNFVGHFEDTAAVWSAILLDEKCLTVLLANNAKIESLGALKGSLLHWVAVAVKMSNTPDRLLKAKYITELLIQRGIDLNATNLLGLPASYYADGEFRNYLERKISDQKQSSPTP